MTALANKTVLIAPLDWGLGHAARCMPVIDLLQEKGCALQLAGNGYSLNFLKDKYPDLPFYELPGYDIQYPIGRNAAVQTLMQSPRIFRTIKKEHALVEILAKHKIDAIISDNRYGVWNKQCRNIIICHHIALQAPAAFSWMNPVFLKTHFSLMKNFDALWIPDEAGEQNLSGKLSHGFPIPISHSYIGIQSRFSNLTKRPSLPVKKYRVVALLSGTEPQRTYFEEQLMEQLLSIDEACLLVRGVTDKKDILSKGKLDIISYMQAEDLYPVLQQTAVIVCRSGYSTLMDLAVLGKKAILVPTPGQTEQEYLSVELGKKGMAVSVRQNEFDLKLAMSKLSEIKGFQIFSADPVLLINALEKDLWSFE